MENERELLVIDKEDERTDLTPPRKYVVVMHNDDYTPMDFVVGVLEAIFLHTTDRAVQIMLDVHQKGKGNAGVYSKDIAETKAAMAMELARQQEFPFLLTIEPE